MSDPFPRALYDHHFEGLEGPVQYRNGEETREVSVDGYFGAFDGGEGWMESRLEGPLLDMGAGAGRHALYFQERFETVAIERSELLVEVMEERGVEDARVADMFSLPEHFERDRFRSALAVGTQAGLSRSMAGLSAFLDDLAYVTTPDATAVIDGFDPEHERTRGKLDFHDDAAPGLAHRLLQVEYDGRIGEPWLYRLFTPDRIREAAVGTGWEVAEVRYGDDPEWDHVFEVALEKRN
jgi:hypothetical protein